VKYSRSSAQSIKIIYRDIGIMDSAMEPGERTPQTRIVPPIPHLQEYLELLA